MDKQFFGLKSRGTIHVIMSFIERPSVSSFLRALKDWPDESISLREYSVIEVKIEEIEPRENSILMI